MALVALHQRKIKELLKITVCVPDPFFNKALVAIGYRERVSRQESHKLFYLRQSLVQKWRHTGSCGRRRAIAKVHVQPKDIFRLRVLPVEAQFILYPQKDHDAAAKPRREA